MSQPQCLACHSRDTALWASAKDAEYRTTDDAFRFFHCASCDVLFIDPVPSDRLSEIYPANYYSFAPSSRSLVASIKQKLDTSVFRKILARVPGDTLRVLDVGGGAGWQLNTVRATDPRIKHTQIVDLDPGAAALAKENGHAYFCGRIEDFETTEKFDFVLLLNLIEHVDDPGKVLRKVASMLAPHGTVLVKTPNYDALDARVFRHQNWAGYHCPRHWVLFTRESFAALAAASGLDIREFSYTQGAPFWAASFLFWLERRGMVKVTRERPVVYHPLFPLFSASFAALDFARRPFAKTSQMFFVLGKAQRGNGL